MLDLVQHTLTPTFQGTEALFQVTQHLSGLSFISGTNAEFGRILDPRSLSAELKRSYKPVCAVSVASAEFLVFGTFFEETSVVRAGGVGLSGPATAQILQNEFPGWAKQKRKLYARHPTGLQSGKSRT